MKKNLINALTFVAVATMLFLKANSAPQKGMNDTILDNVEALAQNEELPEIVVSCSESCRDGIGKCWKKSDQDERYCQRSEEQTNYCSCAHLPG